MPRNRKAKPVGESRKHRESDDIYNARRRAKRQIEKMERDLEGENLSRKEKASQRMYKEAFQRQIEKTYSPKGKKVTEEAIKAAKSLDVQTLGKTNTPEARKNLIFERQMNLAGAGMPSTIAKTPEMSKAAVKIFYRSTQSVWEGAPAKERNKRILAALGMDSLHDAFIYIMRQNPEAFRAALSANSEILSTEEAEFFEEQPIGDEDIGSPDYLALVNPVSMARAA